MSEMWWPSADKVRYLGFLSSPDLVWAASAVLVGAGGIMFGQVLWCSLLAAVMVLYGVIRWGGVRLRTRVWRQLTWWTRSGKTWNAPLRGDKGRPSRMLGGMILDAVSDGGHLVGVVRARRGRWIWARSSYTVMWPVTCDSVTFAGAAERDRRLALWGDVLGSQCVERDEGLYAERLSWTDVHRAANPHALRLDHARLGVAGPATADYEAHLDGFGTVASAHVVIVSATVTTGQLARAKREGMTGSVDEVLRAAAISVGKSVRARLNGAGFRCGDLHRPVDVARLIVEAGDPYAPLPDVLVGKERYGLPTRTGPNSVEVDRRHVAIDGAYHRCFQLQWPKAQVAPEWMWRPLAVEGPKLVTTVFEALPPSRADQEREGRASRQRSNSVIVAGRRGGEESIRDERKRKMLRADEAAVGQGHDELDCWSMVVITARTPDELNRRATQLREALRVAGKANVRELVGLHDSGVRLALPLGDMVRDTKE